MIDLSLYEFLWIKMIRVVRVDDEGDHASLFIFLTRRVVFFIVFPPMVEDAPFIFG